MLSYLLSTHQPMEESDKQLEEVVNFVLLNLQHPHDKGHLDVNENQVEESFRCRMCLYDNG